MRANDTRDRAHENPQPKAPRASAGLRCKTGLRAGEGKKQQEYLIVKLQEVLVTG